MITAETVQNFEYIYTMYARIQLYCLISAVVFLVLAVIQFFALRIPRVLGELTGRTARKAVQEMRKDNSYGKEQSSAKKTAYKKLTKSKEKTKNSGKSTERKRICYEAVEENAMPVCSDDVVISTANHYKETKTVEMETAVLTSTQMHQRVRQSSSEDFVVLRSIVEIHTDEVI